MVLAMIFRLPFQPGLWRQAIPRRFLALLRFVPGLRHRVAFGCRKALGRPAAWSGRGRVLSRGPKSPRDRAPQVRVSAHSGDAPSAGQRQLFQARCREITAER